MRYTLRYTFLVAFPIIAIAQAAAAAQPIDCSTPVAKAQRSIDKINGDIQGMDKTMAKEEMSQVHGLVSEAVNLLKEARQDCAKSTSPYAEARGVARADAADGYATAADMLHFHYMQAMGDGGMKQMPMQGAAGQKAGPGAMQNMNGMPSNNMGAMPSNK
jgi:hypothetical protein